MKKYRITKYAPDNRDAEGRYTTNEWTDISDIGRAFEGMILDSDEYLKVEQKYLFAIYLIAVESGAGLFKIKDLERPTMSRRKTRRHCRKHYGIELTGTELDILSICEGNIVDLQKAILISRMILRNYIWCNLESVSPDAEMEISFGWDYYMYITTAHISCKTIRLLEKAGIYVEEMIWSHVVI